MGFSAASRARPCPSAGGAKPESACRANASDRPAQAGPYPGSRFRDRRKYSTAHSRSLLVSGRADASRGLGVGAVIAACQDRGVRFHDLRHTWASWHVMSGTSLQELMELGGWKSYDMVLRYAHLAPEHLSTAAQRIERAWSVVESDSTISLRSHAHEVGA